MVIIALSVRGFPGHGMVVVEVGGDYASCLPGKEEVNPSLPSSSHGEPLDGSSRHGPPQERWLAVGEAHDDSTQAASEGGEAQAIESVSDTLEAPNVDGFAEGKAIVCETLASGNGDKLEAPNYEEL
jgi:hypothetical protein